MCTTCTGKAAISLRFAAARPPSRDWSCATAPMAGDLHLCVEAGREEADYIARSRKGQPIHIVE